MAGVRRGRIAPWVLVGAAAWYSASHMGRGFVSPLAPAGAPKESKVTTRFFSFGSSDQQVKSAEDAVIVPVEGGSSPTPVVRYTGARTVSEDEVRTAQKEWSDAIKMISKVYLEGGDYVAAAAEAAGELYGYGHTNVLFKPTRAKTNQFRPMAAQAMSYFVGNDAADEGIPEDSGFAINGGKGWSDVVFDNHQIDVSGPVAIAMGNYYFTDASDGSRAKVEYTFGYKKNLDGKVRIFLHHSSLPFGPSPSSEMTEEDVVAAQKAWAKAIVGISKAYLDGGEYIKLAEEAAGELYGYGYGDVLFKPTRAADAQFRPMAEDAMSYFIGHQNVEGGYEEDTGFAINGGKGWSKVVFDNHQVEITPSVAIAMGNYYFTSAEDGSKAKVEYTFGYKKTPDGKTRIFLHHSSLPFAA